MENRLGLILIYFCRVITLKKSLQTRQYYILKICLLYFYLLLLNILRFAFMLM